MNIIRLKNLLDKLQFLEFVRKIVIYEGKTMKIERIKINNIPSIIWGEKSSKVFIAVHGNMSNKEDEVIKILADKE